MLWNKGKKRDTPRISPQLTAYRIQTAKLELGEPLRYAAGAA